MAASTSAAKKTDSNDVLAALRDAVRNASTEEREALAKELGVGRSIGSPARRKPRRETNESALQMSRVSGGAAHGPAFVPAPPDWVVQHGGGMRTHQVDTVRRNSISGKEEVVTEESPIPGDDAYLGNWAVEIYRDRWLSDLPPLPTTQAYDGERARTGAYDDTYNANQLANAEHLAATATMEDA